MYGDVNIVSDFSGDGKMEGLTMEAMDRANDVALVNMIEKIEIDGKEKPVKIDTIDELPADDVDNLIEEVQKITSKSLGNEKRTRSTGS